MYECGAHGVLVERPCVDGMMGPCCERTSRGMGFGMDDNAEQERAQRKLDVMNNAAARLDAEARILDGHRDKVVQAGTVTLPALSAELNRVSARCREIATELRELM